MNVELLLQHFHTRSQHSPEQASDPDSLIGFFQNFRPGGEALQDLFSSLDLGGTEIAEDLNARISELFEVAGDDRRPQGGRDAYFVVRKPVPLDPSLASDWANQWLSHVRDLAISVGDFELVESLDPTPTIRVLEGMPPKHPKAEDEKASLLKLIEQNLPMLVQRIDAGPVPAVLRPAYYFIACDAALRDYLMWPLYATAAGIQDPFLPYFRLWRHGVKYRIFEDNKMDLYLPRPTAVIGVPAS
ncbi:hypothetical protein Poly51_32980 [Rubripirellula tenax]|uniref:Apolipoprotein acyltransferase n=1 Tax=Rubripirellula tenax TaxID=2528015 RepID=A0A5C6F455_9BACT|nr:apolipoprotein acyltransferase [Rubripirellula tenax]TWU54579.1 hypothetical protein Poly51_32980 [Rubripirellula tenax]